MPSLNELRLRPAAALESRALKNGVRLVKQLDRAEYLALDEAEQKVFDRLDGKLPVGEVLHALLLEGLHPRLRAFYQLVVAAVDKGILVEGAAEPPPAGPRARRWPVGYNRYVALALPVVAIALGAPVLWDAGGAIPWNGWEWLGAAATFVLAMSLAGGMAGCVLHGFGRKVYRARNPFWFSVDARDAFMGGRLCEACVALQRMSAPFLLALPANSLGLPQVMFGCLMAALVLVMPFGRTPAHDLLFALLRRGYRSPRAGASFLSARAVAQVFDWHEKLHEDRYYLVYSTWAIAWLGLFFRFASVLFQQQGVLLAGHLARAPGALGKLLPLAGLCVVGAAVAAPVGYLLWVLLKGFERFLDRRLPAVERGVLARHRKEGSPPPRQVRDFLRETLLFSQLSPEGLDAVAQSMKFLALPARKTILREREPGDALYVVFAGEAEVLKENEAGRAERVAFLRKGDVFGEVALLDRVPRTSTVRARGPVSLLALDRAEFERIVVSWMGAAAVRNTIQVSAFLRRHPLFEDWSPQALLGLSRQFAVQPVRGGEVLIREGHPNSAFYLVLEGSLDVYKQGALCATLGPGDFCGEISLLRDVPATAEVVAQKQGRCLKLPKEQFLEFVSRHFLTGLAIERALEERLGEGRAP
jgi:CRP-like cAMP-binding protein